MRVKSSKTKSPAVSADRIFPGIWRNTWTHGAESDFEIFEIRNGVEYHILKKEKVNGRWVHDHHRFNIKILEVNEKEVSFSKQFVGEDRPEIVNRHMKLIGPGRIEGIESDSAKVVYTREE